MSCNEKQKKVIYNPPLIDVKMINLEMCILAGSGIEGSGTLEEMSGVYW